MSWLSGFTDEAEILNQQSRIQSTAKLPEPGFFTGVFGATVSGAQRGVIEGAGAAESFYLNTAITGGPEQNIFDYTQSSLVDDAGQALLEADIEQVRKETAESVMELRPDPRSVGVAGQILGEVAAVIPRAVVGGVVAGLPGAAIAAGAPAGYSRKAVAMAEGVDESTATKLGVIEGVTTAVGVGMPAAKVVKSLAGDAALVIGANVGLGMAHRGASAALLESNGYHAQAAQYRAFDGKAIAVDVILGSAFFGIGRVGMPKPTPEQVDAALTERNIRHADIDTAPGLPVDPRSAVAHRDALRATLESLNRGEAVVLPDSIHSAIFLRDTEAPAPVAPSREQALASAKEELVPVIRAELEQISSGNLPKVRDVQAELATVAKSLDELDGTFKTRAKEFQQQGQSRKKAERSARASIVEERAQLTERQSELNDGLSGIRSADQASTGGSALNLDEAPEHTRSPRQTAELDARDELDTLVREYDATLPREPYAAPGPKIDDVEVPAKVVTARSGEAESGRPKQSATEKNATGRGGSATQSPKNLTEGPENITQAPKTQPSFPELEMLRSAVARNPEAMIRSGFDEEGRPMEVRADDVLQAIETEHATGVREASSYTAAITCLLRF